MAWYNPFQKSDKRMMNADAEIISFARGETVRVSEKTMLAISAYYRGVNILSNTLACLPIHVYDKRSDGSRSVVDNKTLIDPCPYLNWFEFVRLAIINLLLRGRFIAEFRDGQFFPISLHQVSLSIGNRGRITYTVKEDGKPTRVLLADEVLDLRGFTMDGITCETPISLHAKTFEIAIESDNFAHGYLKNSAKISSYIKTKRTLNDDQLKRARQELEKYARTPNSTAVFDQETDLVTVQLNAKDAQILEARQFSIKEIARILGLPPHLLGDLDRATFSNIEQQNLDFILYSLTPYVALLENALKRVLLTKSSQYVKLNLGGLLRGDSAARSAFYVSMVSNGIMTINEARELEELNPIDGGDVARAQLNMAPLTQEVQEKE